MQYYMQCNAILHVMTMTIRQRQLDNDNLTFQTQIWICDSICVLGFLLLQFLSLHIYLISSRINQVILLTISNIVIDSTDKKTYFIDVVLLE
jgi:hypothetical protein